MIAPGGGRSRRGRRGWITAGTITAGLAVGGCGSSAAPGGATGHRASSSATSPPASAGAASGGSTSAVGPGSASTTATSPPARSGSASAGALGASGACARFTDNPAIGSSAMAQAVVATAKGGVSQGTLELLENSSGYPGPCTETVQETGGGRLQLVVSEPTALSPPQRSGLTGYLVGFLRESGDFTSVTTTGS